MSSKQKVSPNIQKVLLFLFFFCVIATFWSLKPFKNASVIKDIGPTYYPLVKQGSLVFIPFVLMFFYAVVRYLTRATLIYLFASIFTVGTLAFWGLYQWDPSTVTKMAFYYYVDIYITVMVALFWMYMNSSFETRDAKKFYGIIGAGGILGGFLGSTLTGTLSTTIGSHVILMSAVFLVVIFGVIALLERGVPPYKIEPPKKDEDSKKSKMQVLTEGVAVVAKDRYLLAIAAVVGLYEVASAIIDYQFNASATAAYPSVEELSGFYGKVFGGANLASFLMAVFGMAWIQKRFGMLAALMLLPLAMALGSAAFLVVPVLAVIATTSASEATLAYSINQASKEILYVPLDNTSKFKAKAFIDMFVFRFSKAIGGILITSLVVTLAALQWDSRLVHVIGLVTIGMWLFAVRYVSKEFVRREAIAEKAGKSPKTSRLERLPSS